MSDWLTKLAAKERAEKAKREAQISTEESEKRRVQETERRSYQQHQEAIERIYAALTEYAKRASDSGFTVNTVRREINGFAVVGTYTTWDEDGQGTAVAQLELTPWNGGFRIHYNGRVSPRTKSFISYWRVNEKVIAKWVRWSVGEGPSDLVEDRWFRIIFIGCPITLVLAVLIVLLFVFISAYIFSK